MDLLHQINPTGALPMCLFSLTHVNTCVHTHTHSHTQPTFPLEVGKVLNDGFVDEGYYGFGKVTGLRRI